MINMKNKNILLITFGLIFLLVSFITAEVIIKEPIIPIILDKIDKIIPVTIVQLETLEEINLDTYDVKDYEIGTDEVKRCLNKEGVINTCETIDTSYQECSLMNITYFDGNETSEECLAYEKVYYTEEEIIEKLDAWELERINNIASVTASRESNIPTLVREGVTRLE